MYTFKLLLVPRILELLLLAFIALIDTRPQVRVSRHHPMLLIHHRQEVIFKSLPLTLLVVQHLSSMWLRLGHRDLSSVGEM